MRFSRATNAPTLEILVKIGTGTLPRDTALSRMLIDKSTIYFATRDGTVWRIAK